MTATAKKASHTPGPWESAVSVASEPLEIKSKNHKQAVAYINGQHAHNLGCTIPPEEWQANAALIAAAPDLLAACEYTLDVIERAGASDGTVTGVLRAAIAKARG